MNPTRSIHEALASVRRARKSLAEGSLEGIANADAALDKAIDLMRRVRLALEAGRPARAAECTTLVSEVKSVANLCDRLGETVTEALLKSSEGENTYGEPPGGSPNRRSFLCEV
jgi:hypothetical protein